MTLLSILIRQLKNNLESIFTLPLLLEQKKAPRGVIFYLFIKYSESLKVQLSGKRDCGNLILRTFFPKSVPIKGFSLISCNK